MNTSQISRPLQFQCNLDYRQMPVVNGSRFCDQCCHAVHDFTHATEAEFLEKRAQMGGRVCGVFRADNAGHVIWRQRSRYRDRLLVVAMALVLCFSSTVTADAQLRSRLDQTRSEMLALKESTSTLYFKFTNWRAPIENEEVEILINGTQSYVVTTDSRGRCTVQVPLDTWISYIEVKPHNRSMMREEVNLKASDASTRVYKFKYNNDSRERQYVVGKY
ncbi:MAG: hypothetical protein JNM00_02505 [Flavobacteriales bacterium]|nr:hypothetical protein [Flavobacteriales bacterium]